MKKVTQFVFTFSILLSVLLSGCMTTRVVTDTISPANGQVYALQLGSTLRGMQMAIQGHSGSFIFQRGTDYVFAWGIKDAWAFVCLNSGTLVDKSDELMTVLENGNVTSCRQMGCITKILNESGWKAIGPSAIPAGLRTAIAGASTVLAVSQSLVSILVLPPGAIYMLDEYGAFGGEEL